MKAKDLRIGNILNYDTGEGIEPIVIDWQDLRWLSENEESFNKYHSPIPLTEEILLDRGFIKVSKLDKYGKDYELKICEKLHNIKIQVFFDADNRLLISKYMVNGTYGSDRDYIYLHDLQNLIYSLTGEELKIELKS